MQRVSFGARDALAHASTSVSPSGEGMGLAWVYFARESPSPLFQPGHRSGPESVSFARPLPSRLIAKMSLRVTGCGTVPSVVWYCSWKTR
jgi:hypothetical protein